MGRKSTLVLQGGDYLYYYHSDQRRTYQVQVMAADESKELSKVIGHGRVPMLIEASRGSP